MASILSPYREAHRESLPVRILGPVKTTLSPTPMQQATTDAVPLLDLRRQYEGIREEVLAAIARVCDSQGFILGPEVEALEREIAAFTGAAGAVGCASGTEADRKSTRLNS